MLTSWLTFGVMILIQVAASVWVVARIDTRMATHKEEIDKLREFKHKWAPQEIVLQAHAGSLTDHEGRLRNIESHDMLATLDDHEARIRDLEKHHVSKRAG